MATTDQRVPPELGGKRLDELLVRLFGAGHRDRAGALVRRGRVQVDGQRIWRPDAPVASGARIRVSGDPRPKESESPPLELQLVHADEALLVLDKPAGMLVQPTDKNERGTVAHRLIERFGSIADAPKGERAGLVHRLDRETSGLLLAARTRSAQLSLQRAFREREVEKTYLALVHGIPRFDERRIALPLRPSDQQPDVQRVDPTGSPAETHLRVLARFPAAGPGGRALLECRPRTGRRHQIRVHLAEVGHAIVGDKIYRPKGQSKPSAELNRHALHAARLSLRHPTSGAPLEFEAPLPQDLAQLLARYEAHR